MDVDECDFDMQLQDENGWDMAAGDYYELEGENGLMIISISTGFKLYGWTNASDCTTIYWSNGAQWECAPDWARSAAFEMAQGSASAMAENFYREKNYFYPYSYEEGYEESNVDTYDARDEWAKGRRDEETKGRRGEGKKGRRDEGTKGRREEGRRDEGEKG